MKLFNKLFNNKSDFSEVVDEQDLREDVAEVTEEDVEIVIGKEEAIDKKMSNASPLKKYAELGRIMIAMLKDTKNGNYKQIPWFTIGTVVVALLYILNPLDIVPDFIPGIGYIDDLAVLSMGLGWIESDLHRYLDWKLEQSH